MDKLNANEVYLQNQGLIFMICKRYYVTHKALCDKAGVQLEDLIQEAYFGIIKAVNDYDEAKGYKITTYFYYHLTNRFNELTGNRGYSKLNTLNMCDSLNVSICEDDDALLLIDLITDEGAENDFAQVLDNEYTLTLRKDIQAAISKLPEREGQIISSHYLSGNSYIQIGCEMGIGGERVRQLAEKGIEHLRKSELVNKYKDEYIYSKSMTGTGHKTFANTWTSSTEKVAIFLQSKKSIF